MRRGAFRFTSGQCVCFIKSTRFKFSVHYENFWSYELGRYNGTVVLAKCFKLKSFLSCVLKSRKLKVTKILQILLFLVNLSQLECHLHLNPRGLVFLHDFSTKSFHKLLSPRQQLKLWSSESCLISMQEGITSKTCWDDEIVFLSDHLKTLINP